MKEDQQIEKEVVNFFKKLYSTNDEQRQPIHGLNWGYIIEKRASWLDWFSEEEIKEAIFEGSKDKALGLDRFNFAFFRVLRNG